MGLTVTQIEAARPQRHARLHDGDGLYRKDITGHGMRSAFRTWAEHQEYPERLAEYALAHVPDPLAEAYMRDD